MAQLVPSLQSCARGIDGHTRRDAKPPRLHAQDTQRDLYTGRFACFASPPPGEHSPDEARLHANNAIIDVLEAEADGSSLATTLEKWQEQGSRVKKGDLK